MRPKQIGEPAEEQRAHHRARQVRGGRAADLGGREVRACRASSSTGPIEPTSVTSSPSSIQVMPSAITTRQCHGDHGSRSSRAGTSEVKCVPGCSGIRAAEVGIRPRRAAIGERAYRRSERVGEGDLQAAILGARAVAEEELLRDLVGDRGLEASRNHHEGVGVDVVGLDDDAAPDGPGVEGEDVVRASARPGRRHPDALAARQRHVIARAGDEPAPFDRVQGEPCVEGDEPF